MKKKKIQVRPIDGQLHVACQKLNAEGIIEAVQSTVPQRSAAMVLTDLHFMFIPPWCRG